MAEEKKVTPYEAAEWTVVVGGILAIYGAWEYILKPILEGSGLKSSAEDKLLESIEQRENKEGIWSSNYYQSLIEKGNKSKKKFKVYLYSFEKCEQLAKQIYDAWGWLDDNEEKLYGVFRNINYWSQLSQVCEAYFDEYQVDLYEDIKDRTNQNELLTVLKIVEVKKSGFEFTK